MCLLVVGSVLLVAASLFLYAQPLADDFARAEKGRSQGIIHATVDEYYHWSGRWASCALNYFVTSHFDLVRYYRLLLVLNPALLGVSIYLLLRAGGIGRGPEGRAVLTSIALALYWTGMPHPGENIYWLTGATDNFTGLSLSLLLLAGLVRTRSFRSTALRLLFDAVLVVLAFTTSGFHELFAVVLCVVLIGGTIRNWRTRDPRRYIWTSCLVAALMGFLLVYAAPGNAVRRAGFPLAAHLGITFRLTLKQGMKNVGCWICDPGLLSATMLFLIFNRHGTGEYGRHRGAVRDLQITVLTWSVALGAAFGGASWATGSKLILRTLDGIYLVFLCGWLWFLLMFARDFSRHQKPLHKAGPWFRGALVGVFVASLLFSRNMRNAFHDLQGTAPAYRRGMQVRWRLLETAAKSRDPEVVVEPIEAQPRSYINYFGLRENPDYWENTSMAHYFGVRTVRLARNEEH